MINYYYRWAKNLVPQTLENLEYKGWSLKNLFSDSSCSWIGLWILISYWDLFTTPIYPNFKGKFWPVNILVASVPLSIISSFVKTPIVLSPWISTSLANFNASDVAKSEGAYNHDYYNTDDDHDTGWTANITAFDCEMNPRTIFRMVASISTGWSPTGTLIL